MYIPLVSRLDVCARDFDELDTAIDNALNPNNANAFLKRLD